MHKKISKGDKDKQHTSLLEKQMYILEILKKNPDGLSKGFLWRDAQHKLDRSAYETAINMAMSSRRLEFRNLKQEDGRIKSVYLITSKGLDALKNYNS